MSFNGPILIRNLKTYQLNLKQRSNSSHQRQRWLRNPNVFFLWLQVPGHQNAVFKGSGPPTIHGAELCGKYSQGSILCSWAPSRKTMSRLHIGLPAPSIPPSPLGTPPSISKPIPTLIHLSIHEKVRTETQNYQLSKPFTLYCSKPFFTLQSLRLQTR